MDITVVLLKSVDLVAEVNCYSSWRVRKHCPLEALALIDSTSYDYFASIHCLLHNLKFPILSECPNYKDIPDIVGEAGNKLRLPIEQAEWLINNNLAKRSDDHSHTDTIVRTNNVLARCGLPTLDEEALSIINIPSRPSTGRPLSPAGHKLANDIGIAPEDLKEMRKLGSAKRTT